MREPASSPDTWQAHDAAPTSSAAAIDAVVRGAPGATPMLQGRRCVLRPLRAAEVPALTRLADDPEVTRHLPDGFKAREWCGLDSAAHGFDFLSIEARAEGAAPADESDAIGFIVLRPGPGCLRCSAEVSYWIGRPWWGNGIASDALSLLTNWAWRARPGLTRLHADVFASNAASARVAEKCGYTLECVRGRAAMKGDRTVDILQYAVHRPAVIDQGFGAEPSRVASFLREPLRLCDVARSEGHLL
jgi:[ribosomal protein S5]-alanine N-acetyltransferase